MNQFENIPALLKEQHQWVVWGIPGKFPKAPFQPDNLLKLRAVPAKSGIPETWSSFEAAAECVRRGLARGIGYEFTGNGIYGVDLDHVIENGIIKPEARRVIKQLASYTEVSPSGHGLHIFVTAPGTDITRHRRQGCFIEIYSKARYFTITGNICGDYREIQSRPNVLQMLHNKYLLPEPSRHSPLALSVESPQIAEESLRRGLEKDPALRACWNGEQRRGDESASDQAFMNKLAYWCNANQDAMLAAFMQSPYFGQKDETHKQKCRRADYLPNTAKTACATLRSTAHEDTLRYRQLQSRIIER